MKLLALVIDTDACQRSVVRNALKRDGWEVREAASVEAAMCFIGQSPSWRLVFCDAELSGHSVNSTRGLTLLGELKECCGESGQVVITASAGSPITPLEALLNGASEYIRKPLQEDKILEFSHGILERLRAADREEREKRCGALTSGLVSNAPEFVGESEAVIKVFKDLARIVRGIRHDSTERQRSNRTETPQTSIFISGETGTGKELIARLIHQHSSQTNGRFVPVNCSGLLPDLAESQLFGHTPGAFTGALKEKEGLWELADGGTLFLDEITEAPPSVLPKLLRVLQDGQMKRLGSNRLKQTHVQVVAASNRDMQAEVNAGRFRADLYHRLSLHKLHIPPLRERLEDIPLIVQHFARRHFTRQIHFAQEALDVLMSYGFPGNVRELENIVRGAARKSPDGVVYAYDLAAYVEMIAVSDATQHSDLNELTMIAKDDSLTSYADVSGGGLDEQMQRFKIQVVRETLARHRHNISQAARALKISRTSLYNILKDIEREDKTRRVEGHAHEAGERAFAAGVN